MCKEMKKKDFSVIFLTEECCMNIFLRKHKADVFHPQFRDDFHCKQYRGALLKWTRLVKEQDTKLAPISEG